MIHAGGRLNCIATSQNVVAALTKMDKWPLGRVLPCPPPCNSAACGCVMAACDHLEVDWSTIPLTKYARSQAKRAHATKTGLAQNSHKRGNPMAASNHVCQPLRAVCDSLETVLGQAVVLKQCMYWTKKAATLVQTSQPLQPGRNGSCPLTTMRKRPATVRDKMAPSCPACTACTTPSARKRLQGTQNILQAAGAATVCENGSCWGHPPPSCTHAL